MKVLDYTQREEMKIYGKDEEQGILIDYALWSNR